MTNIPPSIHWNFFVNIPINDQGAVGTAPSKLAAIGGHFDDELSNVPLNRYQVLEICRSSVHHPWNKFITIMAWGAQDKVPNGKNKVLQMFKQRNKIIAKVNSTISVKSRREAFEIWSKDPVSNLWIAYFTKILFFLCYPNHKVYILDKWTANSTNLIFGEKLIQYKHMHNHLFADESAVIYENFCDFIDAAACKMSNKNNDVTGLQVESALFSKGGKISSKGEWRSYLIDNIGDQMI